MPSPDTSLSPQTLSSLASAGQRCFPWRILVGIAGLGIGACVIRPRDLFGAWHAVGTAASIGLVVLGLALRSWAAACAGGHTRSANIEAPQLVTAGPYSFVRNPIYLGSFVLGFGMIGLLGDPWLILPHLLVFSVFFGMIIPAEETFLARHFGEEYRRFQRAVPRLVPRLRSWTGRVERPLVWRAARGEGVIALALIVIYAGFRALVLLRDS